MNDLASPSTVPVCENLAQLLKSAGDTLRLQILRVLSSDSFGVTELCHLFKSKQSGMSHHLKVLAKAGLVGTRREGNSIFYRRVPASVKESDFELKAALFKTVDLMRLSDDVLMRMNDIHAQRAQSSKDFFAHNAQAFRERQDLIAEFPVYGDHVAQALEHSSDRHCALEIGPGAGEFLPALAQNFEQIVALDNSQTMLDKACKLAEQNRLDNVDFVCSDTRYCREHAARFDCIVCNMVLHHTASPQHLFDDVSYSLKPNGLFVVCDLCRHNQDWARETCGDMWLGFDKEDLSQWAREAQLQEGQSDYIALRNGFQIQIRCFLKTDV